MKTAMESESDLTQFGHENKAAVMKWQVGDGLLYRGAGSFYPGNHGAAPEVLNCAALTQLTNSISGATLLVNELAALKSAESQQ